MDNGNNAYAEVLEFILQHNADVQVQELKKRRQNNRQHKCLLDGCENYTDHNKGFCSSNCFKINRDIRRFNASNQKEA